MAYTKNIGIRDFYKYYKETAEKKGISYQTYKVFAQVLRDFNSRLREKIVYESETVNLPFRLGELQVHKFRQVYTERNKKSWPIDYKTSKEQGRTVYYESLYGYKWRWNKKACAVSGRKYYKFKACRTSNRMIADAVKNKNIDYYT